MHEARARTLTTLVTGASAGAREAAIAAALEMGASASRCSARAISAIAGSFPDCAPNSPTRYTELPHSCALILEGLPDASSMLAAEAIAAMSPAPAIHRIAPGCLCCAGNLVLRVTLNRILRHRPMRLYVGLATAIHLEQLQTMLKQAPYDQLLELTPVLHVGAA